MTQTQSLEKSETDRQKQTDLETERLKETRHGERDVETERDGVDVKMHVWLSKKHKHNTGIWNKVHHLAIEQGLFKLLDFRQT